MTPVDPFTIYLTAAGAIVLGIIIISLISRFASGSDNKQRNDGQLAQASPQAADCPPHGPGGIRRGGARRRMRVHHNVSDEENSDEDIVSQVQQSEGKLGAKKLQKLQKKAERKAVREEMERERQDRKQREQEAEEKQKKMEEQEKREQTLKEEEERKAHEEKERWEHEEYLKLKEAFSVDAEGQDEAEADLNSESLLQEFIKYIKDTKVVMLEELAAHFKLRTQDVIQRVQDLQACGNITGVIDDRGKFIYITTQELEAVAKYVKQHGRVSKADLAASSNRLITLDCQLQFVTKETS